MNTACRTETIMKIDCCHVANQMHLSVQTCAYGVLFEDSNHQLPEIGLITSIGQDLHTYGQL